MLCLGDELLYSTVRLTGNTNNGLSIGTGFFYKYEDKVFLVTNKHVVKGVTSGLFYMFKGEEINNILTPVTDDKLQVNFSEHTFIGHPDDGIDVSVANISDVITGFWSNNIRPFWRNFEFANVPTTEQVNKFISPIEDVIFIGYPNGIWDSVNGLPIMRKGITATPYYIDFMSEKKFLIDASVFPGSSGSPVLIYYAGGYPDREGGLYAGNQLFFLGIIAQVYQRDEEGEIKITSVPTAQKIIPITKQMIDLGIVFKASTIIESIEHYMSVIKKKIS